MENILQRTPRYAAWREIFPLHRLPVVAKTPLLIALGLYLSGGAAQPGVFGTLLLVSLLWCLLYAQNEVTDLARERQLPTHPVMKWLLFGLPAVLCLLTALFRLDLCLLCCLMTVGQMVYSMEPIRLKQRWWGMLLLSGGVNPTSRLLCGAVWGHAAAISPWVYAVFVLLHIGPAIRTRVMQRERDASLGYFVAPAGIEYLGMALSAIGQLGAIAICLSGILPRWFTFYAVIGALFTVYAWSGHAENLPRLRKWWVAFALLSLLATVLLIVLSIERVS